MSTLPDRARSVESRALPVLELKHPIEPWVLQDIPLGGMVSIAGSGFAWESVDHAFILFSTDPTRGKALLSIVDHGGHENGRTLGMQHLVVGSPVQAVATNRPPRSGCAGLRIVVDIVIVRIPHCGGLVQAECRYRRVPFA